MNLHNNKIHVIIPAAGIGSRMQSDIPKQYLELANKRVIEHSLELFCSLSYVSKVHVGIRYDDDIFPTLNIASHPKVSTFIGGEERFETVLLGLEAIDNDAWVMVHDAARPGLTGDIVERLVTEVLDTTIGAIVALPVVDTLRRSVNGVTETVSRENMWQAQTPQMFKVEELNEALNSAITSGKLVTDEASAMELMQKPIQLVHGSPVNMKLTSPSDLELLNKLLG